LRRGASSALRSTCDNQEGSEASTFVYKVLLLESTVAIRLSSLAYGTGCFAVLAGFSAYAWGGFAIVGAAVEGVWVAGGGVSRSFGTFGAVQLAGCGGSGGFQEAGV
jgi:hypothetical protein